PYVSYANHLYSTLRLPFSVILRRSTALLDLPSFPTRRSSDLPRSVQRVDHGRASVEHRTANRPDDPGVVVHDVESVDLQVGGERDRKSTRLNSSHGSISYAVFCLKKKKKTKR